MAELIHFTVVFLALLERLMKVPDDSFVAGDDVYAFMVGLYAEGSPFGTDLVQKRRTAKEMARLLYRRPQNRQWFAERVAQHLEWHASVVIPAADKAWLLIEEALELTAPVSGGFTTINQAMNLIAPQARNLVPPDGL